jgi:hypothetical protein
MWTRINWFDLCIIYLYLSVDGLFNDDASMADYIMMNDRGQVNKDLARIWKEAVVA